MSSTSQLAVGLKGKLSMIKPLWLNYNSNSGYPVQVSQNVEKTKARYFSVCYSAPKTGWNDSNDCCKAHLKAIGDTREEMTVVSLDLCHTCGNNNKRKRNYLTHDIAEVPDVLALYQRI